MKCCGTCKYFENPKPGNSCGVCIYPIPEYLRQSACYFIQPERGQECSTYKQKEIADNSQEDYEMHF